MRIPRQLTIDGRKIKVRFVEMEKGCAGKADFENGLILIKKGMKRSAQESTFFHEAMHHCNTSMNHALLDSISGQMYSMLRNNKMLR